MWSNSYSCIRPGSLMSMSSRSCRNTPQNRNCRSSRWLKPYSQKNRHPHSPYSSSRCSRCYSLYSRCSPCSLNSPNSHCNHQNTPGNHHYNHHCILVHTHYHSPNTPNSLNIFPHIRKNMYRHIHCIYYNRPLHNRHNSSLCTHYHSRRYTLCMLRHILIRIHNNHYSHQYMNYHIYQNIRFHNRQNTRHNSQSSYSRNSRYNPRNKNRYSPNTTSYTRMRSHPHSPYSSSRCSYCCTRSTPNTPNR